MKRSTVNIITLALSGALSVFWVFYSMYVPPFRCDGSGFDCLGNAMLVLLLNIFVTPIVLGFLGAYLAKENRPKQALISFGISFAVAVLLALPIYLSNVKESRERTERQYQEMVDRYEANPEQYKRRPY